MPVFRIPMIFSTLWRRRLWRLDTFPGAVYLTFDDGPIHDVTPWVLDLLKQSNIKATFFCVGENVSKYPDIYQRILSEGHTVGNHTMHHEKGPSTNLKNYISSVNEASQYISSSLFRPPYGRLTWLQSIILRKKFRIIMWSWLSYDFDPTVPLEHILQKARSEIRSGDIIVLHDRIKSFERLQQILPELIAVIMQKGLTFLPIEN